MDGQSLNITQDLITKLKEIVPGAFTEDKLNIDQLKQLLGEDINTDNERYQLNWAGKNEAYKALQFPTTSTLQPNKEESINWDNTENVFIEGENFETLKVLQKSYYGKIDAIYIDPPYNTGSDSFIYPDKFSETKEEYLKRTGEKDDDGQLIKEGTFRSNKRENGQYHSNWLSMMLPRLFLSRNLLADDGFIFVSIDDNELASLKLLMDEIYGEENFRNIILVRRYDKNINTQFLSEGLKSFNTGAEYVLIYSKNALSKMSPVFREASEERKSQGYWKGFWNGAERKTMQYDLLGVNISEGQWKWQEKVAQEAVNNYKEYQDKFSDEMTLEEYWLKTGSTKKFIRRNSEGKGKNLGVEHWIAPNDKILRNTLWQEIFASKYPNIVDVPFDNPKNVELLKLLISIAVNDKKQGYVLDFFAGSGSTAHAVIEYNIENEANLNFITIQLPEEIGENSSAYSLGYRYISEVTKKRISDVISYWSDKIQNQLSFTDNTLDLGFRSFTLTPSNFKIWRSDLINSEQDLVKQTNLFKQPVNGNPASFSLLVEILIKNGLELSSKIEEVNLSNSAYYLLNSGRIAVVLDNYSEEIQTDILIRKPNKVICLDTIFNGDDCKKTNTILKLEQESISFQSI